LLADIEGEGAFGVGDLGAGDGGLIAGGLETMLPFAAALEEVGDSDIELLSFIEVFAGKILGAEKWDELRVGAESRVRTEVGGDLLSLVLKDRGAGGEERMVVCEGEVDGLVEGDTGHRLGGTGGYAEEQHRGRGEGSTREASVPRPHK